MTPSLREKAAAAPSTPGVYIMKNARQRIIYVGKAANLKNRLTSYFSGRNPTDIKTGVLVGRIASFETIQTPSEKEALILESNLIKKHRPRYNVILKDDKRYPSLRLDMKSDYPCLQVVRRIRNDGALYFGPFASAGAVRQTLKLIHKTFKLRKCTSTSVKPRSRPCLYHQMGLCLAPCCKSVSPEAYNDIVNEVRLFLNGRTAELTTKIKTEMEAAAGRQEFEKAAQLRDKLFAVEKTMEKQVAVTTDFVNRDVIGLASDSPYALLWVMFVRNGFMQGAKDFYVHDDTATGAEIIEAFLKQHYESTSDIPEEILIPCAHEDVALYTQWLSQKKGKKVRIHYPKRGDKVRLIRMAEENAQTRLASHVEAEMANQSLLEGVRQRLHLERLPRRIECIDNSGISGRELVSGMVVYEDGAPNKSEYRRYIIRNVDQADDYACMAEVLERRFHPTHTATDSLPDLLIIDGGKGQLNIAVSVLKQMGLQQAFGVIGIAKKDPERSETADKVYIPGRRNPLNLNAHTEVLYFIQRIRDEAHRYAVTYHRQRRTKTALRSRLDGIQYIGEKRKAVLLRHFKSIRRLKAASVEELAGLPGMSRRAAENIQKTLNAEE
ncbi:MAG: excinuclease ABC subunit UvrC [Desulfobacterales bacterium]|nr:excinuclease ABC subunit UvrC [Desulfobacterales bacterium]